MEQFLAAQISDLARLYELVSAANVDERDEGGKTVLHHACWGGHHDIVEWLLGLGANKNPRDRFGRTPLWVATLLKHPRCVQLVLAAGADAGIARNDGRIPLHYAYDSADCTALLISAHPAGVNVVDNDGETPLHAAARRGIADVCRLLVAAGNAIDVVDNNGFTPLYWALCYDKHDVAELLLDRGARLDRVKLDDDLKSIPEWAVSFVASRNACRSSCWAVLELARRRSRVIGGNRRDVLRLIAKCMWELRLY